MRLVIEIDTEKNVEGYLALVALGILDGIKENQISPMEAMTLLMRPRLFSLLEDTMPELADALHLGSELGNVYRIVPDAYARSIEQMRQICLKLIDFSELKGKCVRYSYEP